MKLTVGSLFSGIGGLEHGLEMTGGFETRWHSEIEPYPCEVLAKLWPDVPNLGDITQVDWAQVEPVDLICGGFPCQDISVAGKGAGIKDGTRSGLWFEFAKAIRILRPRFVVIENVAALVIRGLDIVLCDLAALGYDAEWAIVRASDVGAPHRRERLFIVADAQGITEREPHDEGNAEPSGGQAREVPSGGGAKGLADPPGSRLQAGGRCEGGEIRDEARRTEPERRSEELADTDHAGLQRHGEHGERTGERIAGEGGDKRIFQPIPRSDFWRDCEYIAGRPVKPGVRLLAHGVSRRMAKLKALGNGVVPQCAEYIGRCILEEVTKTNG